MNILRRPAVTRLPVLGAGLAAACALPAPAPAATPAARATPAPLEAVADAHPRMTAGTAETLRLKLGRAGLERLGAAGQAQAARHPHRGAGHAKTITVLRQRARA
jgi:hypothetical protein